MKFYDIVDGLNPCFSFVFFQSTPNLNYAIAKPMNLCRLIYSSYASPNTGYEDLKDIMEKSEQNNRRDGVTGVLCYGDSMFLQILEGNRKIISKTYHRIATDKRHHTPTLIECVSAESRLFQNWSMQAVKLVDLNAEEVRQLILQYSDTTTFQPDLMTAQQCLKFIYKLSELKKK